jgi:(1->4)-alpha-D-glucan 1-alpha-D-glucosylmutase
VYFGAMSSLSQLVLKITSPGVPDFYRGTDVWNFSLADPDNRRPVNFSQRIAMLEDLKNKANPRELLRCWEDGRLKLFVTWKLLNFRRTHADLFTEGDYTPLAVTGSRASHVIAFSRRVHNDSCIVVVPRLLAKLRREKNGWQDTSIQQPIEGPSKWTNILTNEDVGSPLSAVALFATLPFAVLAPKTVL